MGLHKQFVLPSIPKKTRAKKQASPWLWSWPNTADFNFNFYTLLNGASGSAIAAAPAVPPRIAIIGAGIAGLTAARELYRCGYTNIDIYEATDRIGGRNWSELAPGQGATVYEMGAMRMPFFTAPGSGNSVLDYYRQLYGVVTQPFPDPASVTTGIYINNGLGPAPGPTSTPKLLIWEATSKEPPTPQLQALLALWTTWSQSFQTVAQAVYAEDGWTDFWKGVVNTYWAINFRELVVLPPVTDPVKNAAGDFGGLGMTQAQADLFYVIGAGDGSWGAFYDISALYPIRTLLFGFGTDHQLIVGCPPPGPLPTPKPGVPTPAFLGVQTFSECMYWAPVRSSNPTLDGSSLADALNVNLYMNTAVSRLTQAGSQFTLASSAGLRSYDHVIITPTTWAFEMSVDTSALPWGVLPMEVQSSLKESHWITSCKVFYPLTSRYWEVPAPNMIPQVITTDTYLQDVYGYASGPSDPGVLLLSYTWEDDAGKLEASESDSLAAKCLQQLDAILTSTGYPPISPYVDATQPVVFHWERQPTYRGCAKLYRERSWDMDYSLLRYNQSAGKTAPWLYFAGEGYSVEGGWTEPALRLALDAVIHLIQNSGGTFLNGFSYGMYPRYSNFSPRGPRSSSKKAASVTKKKSAAPSRAKPKASAKAKAKPTKAKPTKKPAAKKRRFR